MRFNLKKETAGTNVDLLSRNYSYLQVHSNMILDSARTDAYFAAIEKFKDFIEGKVVLDVGCGTGILSMFAAKAGAKRVYAVDRSEITHHARKLVKNNGLEGVIKVIQGRIEDIDIPEKVDCIVSEWMGYALLVENMLSSVIYARDRFLVKSGILLPSDATIKVALVSEEKYWESEFDLLGDDVYGLDFSEFDKQVKRRPVYKLVDPNDVVSAEIKVISIDLRTIPLDRVSGPFENDISLIANKTCTVHGIVVWFDVDFNGKISLSTSPAAPRTHWEQVLLPFDEPIEMNVRDELTGNLKFKVNNFDLKVIFNYFVVKNRKTYSRSWTFGPG